MSKHEAFVIAEGVHYWATEKRNKKILASEFCTARQLGQFCLVHFDGEINPGWTIKILRLRLYAREIAKTLVINDYVILKAIDYNNMIS